MPLLEFSPAPADIAIAFSQWTAGSFTLNNAKDGIASNVTVQSNFHTFGPLEVRFSGPDTDGWAYDNATGLFSRPGSIAGSGSATCAFEVRVAPSTNCTPAFAGQMQLQALYEDGCGQEYELGTYLGSGSSLSYDGPPTVSLAASQVGGTGTIVSGTEQVIRFDVTVTADTLTHVDGPVVVDFEPIVGLTVTNIDNISRGSIAGTLPQGALWTIPQGDLARRWPMDSHAAIPWYCRRHEPLSRW